MHRGKIMKRLILLIVVTAAAAVIAAPLAKEDSKMLRKNAPVVPAGKTYVKLDANNREVARFNSGQTAAVAKNCTIVKCPSTFGSDIVCWKCDDLPAATGNRSTVGAAPAAGKQGATAERIKEQVVPTGKTYVKLDANNKEIARFGAGQTTAGIKDCAIIKCPSTFGSDVVCWKCEDRPSTGIKVR